MSYDPNLHRRRSIRLPGYDYASAGAYYVTLCTHERACLFGEVVQGQVRLSRCGRIAAGRWYDLPRRFPFLRLDAFVVMPNHVHGILVIKDRPAAPSRGTAATQADKGEASGTDPVVDTGAGAEATPAVGGGADVGATSVMGGDVDAGTTPVTPVMGRGEEGRGEASAGVCICRVCRGEASVGVCTCRGMCRGEASVVEAGSPGILTRPADSADGTGLSDASPLRLRPGTPPSGTVPGSLGAVVQHYKSTVTRKINRLRGTPGAPVWQRGYYDHIIRTERECERIRRYIEQNPARWDEDRNNPVNL